MTLIATAIVSGDGFRRPNVLLDRMTLAAEIAAIAAAHGARLVALPAGFILCENERRAKGVARSLGVLCAQYKLSVLAGLDIVDVQLLGKEPDPVDPSKDSEGVDERVLRAALPYFVFAADEKGIVRHWWRQRSTTSTNAELVPTRGGARDPRVALLGGLHVAVLACGEIYNPRVGELLGAASPDVIIDLGHFGMGRGFQYTFPTLAAATGAVILHAQHTAAENQAPKKWRAYPTASGEPWTTSADCRAGSRVTTPASSGLWAEILLSNVAPRRRNSAGAG